jgi:molybdopterin-containing oxidoreductase family iron-sulfur binding subunit
MKNNSNKNWRRNSLSETQSDLSTIHQDKDELESVNFLKENFPALAADLNDPITRRSFMSVMGASMALAGLAGCRRPVEKIIPYVIPPEQVIPGIPEYYATTMPFGMSAYGLIVESHEGRPTKVEGNPDHPSTRGMSNALTQASILNLYDPDRSQNPLKNGVEVDWSSFVEFWQTLYPKYIVNQGAGLAILSESLSSPTMGRLKREFTLKFPKARWVAYDPISDENIFAGIKLVSGRDLRPVYDYEKAAVILALDSDFMYSESENITAAKGFADGRRIEDEHGSMNRLYAVESVYSITGGMADHRLELRSSQIGAFTTAIAIELKNRGLEIKFGDWLRQYENHNFDRKWLSALADDLLANRGKGIIVAGRRQPAIVHALVYALNFALGNAGSTVNYVEAKDAIISDHKEFGALVKDIDKGNISTLIMLDGNPAYNSPTEFNFAGAVKKVENTIYLSSHINETSEYANWLIPSSHYLESWGDARAADGTIGIIQPLIQPLFNSKSIFEISNLIVTGEDQSGYAIVRQTWKELIPVLTFEKGWRQVLHDGLLKTDPSPVILAEPDWVKLGNEISLPPFTNEVAGDKLELLFYPAASTYDGRFANNGWLQELPDPITKITWDNPALVSPLTAQKYDLQSGDMIKLEYSGRQIELPIWIAPGTADGVTALTVGYGRTKAGRVGDKVGFDTYKLRLSDSLYWVEGATLTKTGAIYKLACTQEHHTMENRPIIRQATLDQYKANPEFATEMVEHPPLKSLWDEHKYDKGYQWGMAIDLNVCIGCNACTIACQSENNIPVVGKDQVSKGREMHWIRVDRYYAGPDDDAEILHMPVPCQHCENAPCEQVCPVQATQHDKEGLNNMVYNRCVGTRYCSNNCPYKVRRFNFFNHTKDIGEILKMAQNPDVTVRSRGVMEKCTYCLQRINRAKINAKLDSREVQDGEVVTACQEACPTGAISFGNLRDLKSRVAQIKKQNRNYGLLEELNTKPRTTYLARIKNLNPKLEKA